MTIRKYVAEVDQRPYKTVRGKWMIALLNKDGCPTLCPEIKDKIVLRKADRICGKHKYVKVTVKSYFLKNGRERNFLSDVRGITLTEFKQHLLKPHTKGVGTNG